MTKENVNKGLCDDCGKRGKCMNLCEKAERYANLDWVDWGDRVELRDKPDVENWDDDELMSGPIILDDMDWQAIKKAGLSDRQAQAIYLRYWKNMSIEQTADAMQIKKGAAYEHIRRGKAKINAILKTHK